jgi:hypothetical protein
MTFFFLLFPKINEVCLKGEIFQDIEDIKKMTIALKAVPLWEFQKCFHQWQHHWAKCIAAQGEYFEGELYQ